jgi:hypothetical protein
MTAHPIILGAKEYKIYLAARTGSTNLINNDELIETLRKNASLFVEPKTQMLTNVGTEIPCGGPFQPRYQNLNGRWIETSPTLQLAATPINVAELTEDWYEVMPPDNRKLDFTFGGIYDRQAVINIEKFLQTPRATTGVAISLARQSIHTGLGAMEPGHLFTELEDIRWTFWGQWADFAEKYGGPASITIFSLLCIRVLTWAGGLRCRCVALSELYKWTTTGLAACFPSFMACLLARQEGSKRKPTKDYRYCRLNMAGNCPCKRLVLTREADPIFFDALKNEHFLRNGSRNKLRPEVMAKFAPFLRKQAKLTRKRTRSMDNWTGSLSHVGAMKSANLDSGAYNKYGSVDSDIVNYVNCYEVDKNRLKTVKRTQKARPRTPLSPPFPQSPWRRPGFEPDTINEPLPSAPLMGNVEKNMGTEMVTMGVPTLQFVAVPPKLAPPPQITKEPKKTIERI